MTASDDGYSTNATAPDWESLTQMLGIVADWVWEQDAEFRFTRIKARRHDAKADTSLEDLLGFTLWELHLTPIQHAGSWDHLKARLQQKLPFRDIILRYEHRDGSVQFISISGVPSFDRQGHWTGYRGTSTDVTQDQESYQAVQRFQAIMDASPDCIVLADAETHQFTYVNDTACEFTGFTREELLTMKGYEITGRGLEYAQYIYNEAMKGGAAGVTDETQIVFSKDGERKGWWEPHHRGINLDGRWSIVTVSREVSTRVLAEQAMLRAKRMYAALSATNEVIMRAKAPHELYQGVCDAAVSAGGLASATILMADSGSGDLHAAALAGAGKKQIHDVVISIAPGRPEGQGLNGVAFRTRKPCISNDFLNDPRTAPWRTIAKQMGIKAGASIPILRDGSSIGVLFLCANERRAFDEEIIGLLQNMMENLVFGLQNIEHEMDRELAEERVRYLATHDSLTGLPNRVLYGELLDQATITARRYHQQLAVMFIDLDRFKLVNDSLGHAAGDILLKEMSTRMRAVLRESDVLARFGGDEFVILLPNIKHADDAAVVGRKLLDAVLSPITIMEQECRVTASIGISIYPEHGEDHLELMKSADTAMYLAKEKGKNIFEFYTPGMRSQSTERLALETALRNAISNNEFVLNYQAKLDLKTNTINGVEALLRWHHPGLGNISPQQFIPICEETGTIVEIGRWVLNTACRQNVAWQQQGLPPITMAVNLSARQFSDPDLLKDVKAALDDSGMDPKLLELELTESMVMLDPINTIEILTHLRSIGVRIALDDFGVGYSSLAQIKDFPIDTLKVDRSFIRNLPASNQDRAITEAIISMARSLSLTVIAEGVETEAQETFLRGLSCDESQGFYFSKPATAEAFSILLKSHGVNQ